MKTIIFAIAFVLIAGVAHAQGYDPCAAPNQIKYTFAKTITSATTTELVPATLNKNIALCGIAVETVGTSPTWSLEVGTKAATACDTSAAVVSPVFLGPNTAAAPVVLGFGNNEILNTGQYAPGAGVSSSELCMVSAGTVTDIFVYGTYVRQ